MAHAAIEEPIMIPSHSLSFLFNALAPEEPIFMKLLRKLARRAAEKELRRLCVAESREAKRKERSQEACMW
jgi:hypothetical protein